MNEIVSAPIDVQPAVTATSGMPGAMPPQARIVVQMLRRLEHGALRLTCPDGTVLSFGDDSAPVSLKMNNWDPCSAALKSGDIGFAESYITGDWTTDNLTVLLQLLARNRNALEDAIYGSWWGGLLYRLRQRR